MVVYRYATVRAPWSIHRKCQHCGHKYAHNRFIEWQGYADGGAPTFDSFKPYESKFKKKAYNKATYGVLCPQCKEFSAEAMAWYFPAGYRRGLLSMAGKLLFRLLIGPCFTVFFFGAIFLILAQTDVSVPGYAVPGLIGPVLLLILFRIYLYLSVRGSVSRLSDSQIKNFLVFEYLRAGVDSLNGPFHLFSEKAGFPQNGRATRLTLGLFLQTGDDYRLLSLAKMEKRLTAYGGDLDDQTSAVGDRKPVKKRVVKRGSGSSISPSPKQKPRRLEDT